MGFLIFVISLIDNTDILYAAAAALVADADGSIPAVFVSSDDGLLSFKFPDACYGWRFIMDVNMRWPLGRRFCAFRFSLDCRPRYRLLDYRHRIHLDDGLCYTS